MPAPVSVLRSVLQLVPVAQGRAWVPQVQVWLLEWRLEVRPGPMVLEPVPGPPLLAQRLVRLRQLRDARERHRRR